MATRLAVLEKVLQAKKNPKKAEVLQRFFKTGKGQYGEGDIFLGITVPEQRKIAKDFLDLSLSDIKKLLSSPIHEYRLTALEILVMQFEKGDEAKQEKITDFYLKNTNRINNWDLVDASARYILGVHLSDKERKILYELALSKNLWERRIAIIATHHFISEGSFDDTLAIAELLLGDKHDLMHKAVGWMLREAGKKSPAGQKKLEEFLKKHAKKIPRTTLRYAIERFPEEARQYYLKHS